MSVSKVPVTNTLRLRWNMGLDEDMNPIFRFRSWSQVKPSATPEELHVLGEFIGVICSHHLDSIRVTEEFVLED